MKEPRELEKIQKYLNRIVEQTKEYGATEELEDYFFEELKEIRKIRNQKALKKQTKIIAISDKSHSNGSQKWMRKNGKNAK